MGAQKVPEPPKAQWRLGEWFPDLTSEQLRKLADFSAELVRFNSKLNLVSDRSLLEADKEHFADSILAYQAMAKKGLSGGSCYDIGAGNGFPGIVLGIIDPSLKMVLVERDTRKCEFMKFVVGSLKLPNVEIFIGSVENLKADSISLGISRGFAPLAKGLLATRKIFKQRGRYFHMKGPGWVTELSSLPAQICSVWKTEHVSDYTLPGGSSSEKLSLILTTKVSA